MDYTKASVEEFRGMSRQDMSAAQVEIKKQLAEIRIDVYSAPAVYTGKKRKLKKALAQLLTVKASKSGEKSE